MSHFEKTVNEDIIYKGKVFTIKLRDVILENGQASKRELVCHNGGAAVLPLDNEGNLYLIKQYRAPFEQEILEIPAGKLEPKEDPFLAAKRELQEETGFTAKNYTNLGEFYPTVGFCDEIIYLYMATDLSLGNQSLDEDEFVTVEKMPFETVYQMCINGQIKDGKTLVAILKAKAYLKF